jgi:predicted secreted protein with PEFG-CTERM motif
VAGIAATTPTAYADHMTADVSINAGSSVPGCETTNECFTPYQVTIDPGGEVTWSNDDTAAHTVTSGTAKDGPDGNFDSSLFMAGTTFSVKFDDYDAGTYPYFCMVHPWMTGEVIVEEAGHMDEELMATITTSVTAGKTQVDLEFNQQHVNYEITATQNGKVVLKETGHAHTDMMGHNTIPVAASSANPIDIQIKSLGIGLPGEEATWSGPKDVVVTTKQVVPEFGTIAMMILGISIVSIITVTAKSRVIPRL